MYLPSSKLVVLLIALDMQGPAWLYDREQGDLEHLQVINRPQQLQIGQSVKLCYVGKSGDQVIECKVLTPAFHNKHNSLCVVLQSSNGISVKLHSLHALGISATNRGFLDAHRRLLLVS